MKIPSQADIRVLIAHEGRPSLSIHARMNGNVVENAQRFDALLRRSHAELEGRLPPRDLEAFLVPVTQLAQSIPALGRAGGVSVFRSGTWFAAYSYPVSCDDRLTVADRFHVRPLLRFLQSNQRYYLLELSRNHVSLFEGDELGLHPFEAPYLPRSMAETTQGTGKRENATSPHSGAPGHVSVWHGQGNIESAREEDVLHFLRSVAAGVREALHEETAPLVVAAPEKLLALYERANRYPHLLSDGIRGSFANAKVAELSAKAWPIVRAWVESKELALLERYDGSIKQDKAIDEISAIARYAATGRVRELLVDADAHLWGKMDGVSGALDLHVKRSKNDEDVLDAIAESVLLHGGAVDSLPSTRMPTRSPVAALLRW